MLSDRGLPPDQFLVTPEFRDGATLARVPTATAS
jgi:hypothetical protein